MKYIFIFFFCITQVHATTIAQYISKPEGSSVLAFDVTTETMTLKKGSNFFDSKKDYSLGLFKPEKKGNPKEIQQKLETILAKINDVDAFMKKKNSSFNEMADKKPHESFFILDEYRITRESVLYGDVKEIYEELAQLKWKQVKGIRISEDLKKLITIESGYEAKREEFSFRFFCKDAVPPSVCVYRDLGIIYVQ